jgi:DNA-binding NarL/FixJ family response regulator
MLERAALTVVVVGETAGPQADGALGGVTVVGRAADPAPAAALVAAHAPAVVVADRAAPELIEAVATAAPRVPVLALLRSADEALAAIRAGATGLLVDPDPLAELADAVRRTAAGETVFSPGLAELVLSGASRGAVAARLTQRESDVLALVVEGLTARQIATRLVLSPRTVENHVQHVLRKLGLRSRAALVRYAIENGLA